MHKAFWKRPDKVRSWNWALRGSDKGLKCAGATALNCHRNEILQSRRCRNRLAVISRCLKVQPNRAPIAPTCEPGFHSSGMSEDLAWVHERLPTNVRRRYSALVSGIVTPQCEQFAHGDKTVARLPTVAGVACEWSSRHRKATGHLFHCIAVPLSVPPLSHRSLRAAVWLWCLWQKP